MPSIDDKVGLLPSAFPELAHLVGTVEGVNYADKLLTVSFFDETTGELETIDNLPAVFVHVLTPAGS